MYRLAMSSRTEPVIPNIDDVLTTTRAVRLRLDFDRPIEPAVIDRCLELAIQAPSAVNKEHWRFVLVYDEAQRAAIADVFRATWEANPEARAAAESEELSASSNPDDRRIARVMRSARHLIDNMHRIPLHIVICSATKPPALPTGAVASGFYGSVYPAIWSLQLALRSRGLGSTLTCGYLRHEADVAEILGLPDHFTQIALLPVAYTIGTDFKAAHRRPLEEVTRVDRWS